MNSKGTPERTRGAEAVLDRIPRAGRARGAAPSAIREILKVTERPDIISFAGGLPAEELFPVEAMAAALGTMLHREGRGALQYGTTEGVVPLREWIARRLSQHGRPVRTEELIVTHGSQQGIDLTARVLLDPGDTVAVESPSYLAALQVFRGAEARLVPVPMDSHGIDLAGVDRVLAEERPKLLYLVPDHQNPAGSRLPLERRRPLLEICRRHGVAILEDDPYGEICFEGRRHPPLFALDEHGVVTYLSTFSKTLAPGLRPDGWPDRRSSCAPLPS
ncbi:MAG: PLP-dependent aminotransferase family protein [Candidatus Eisenbacteria bacterium]